jgi:hypothetical protein
MALEFAQPLTEMGLSAPKAVNFTAIYEWIAKKMWQLRCQRKSGTY